MPAAVFPQGRGRERCLAPHRRPTGHHPHGGAEADAGRSGAGGARLLGRADGAARLDVPVVRGPGRDAHRGPVAAGRVLRGVRARQNQRHPGADVERARVVRAVRRRTLPQRLLLRQAGRDGHSEVSRIAVPRRRRRADARSYSDGVPLRGRSAAAGAECAHQHLPRALLAHRRRGGKGISRRGEAPRPAGERGRRRCAQGDHDPLGAARHRNAGLRSAAGGARQCAHGLVAPAARGGRGDDARDGAQDPARGDAGAPLRPAIGGLLRSPAVAAEDTRHTKPLLAHVGSRAELISFHAHSSDAALRRILHLLASGKDVALVTDAGTPTVSDPGAVLVAAARERDIPVVTVPGPTAVAAALSVSGLGADRYLFLGFVPRKGADRRRLLEMVAKSEWTVVLFEAPPRVAELLEDLAAACGAERPAAVARELTKLFEETRTGTLAELAGYYAEAPARGEVTVMVAGTGKAPPVEQPPDPEELARTLLAEGLSRKDAAIRLVEQTGISRNTAYRLVN